MRIEFGRRKKETVPNPEQIHYENVHNLLLPESVISSLRRDDNRSLLITVKSCLNELGLDESELVFRGLHHPKGNITEQLLHKYGTDRFMGFNSMRRPIEDINLVPYRNQGETNVLTADTYTVPDLSWSLAYTDLTLGSIENFQRNEADSFLVMYDRSCVQTDRIPEGGGELWRTTFLTEPTQALKGVIHFVPPVVTH
jgi:hypothetical protein